MRWELRIGVMVCRRFGIRTASWTRFCEEIRSGESPIDLCGVQGSLLACASKCGLI